VEVIDTVHPDLIIVETTGVAEPDALLYNIQESLPQVRLDGVVAVADADAMVRYPQLGHTSRAQIEAADIVLLNKVDLVSAEELAQAKDKLARLNAHAPILPTQRCRVDPGVLFGITPGHEASPPHHRHQPEVESFSYVSEATLQRSRFEQFAERLSPAILRAKGFVRFPEGTYLFNFVAGRWELEPFPEKPTTLVFIGAHVTRHQADIVNELKQCER
jgi:G3E family GTPase